MTPSEKFEKLLDEYRDATWETGWYGAAAEKAPDMKARLDYEFHLGAAIERRRRIEGQLREHVQAMVLA